MKDYTFDNTTETRTSLSPYKAERAEAQVVPATRPACAGANLLQLQRQYGNRYLQRLLAQHKGDGSLDLDDETVKRINWASGGGKPLDGTLQQQMSASLGYDFMGVRVHTCNNRGAGGRAVRRCAGGLCEANALLCDLVNVRRLNRAAVAA